MPLPSADPSSDVLLTHDYATLDRLGDAYRQACQEAHFAGVATPDMGPLLTGLPEQLQNFARRRLEDIAIERAKDFYKAACQEAHDAGRPGPDITACLDPLPEELRSTARRQIADIPGYFVVGEQGRGGMGRVYRATPLGSTQRVAVKILEGAEWERVDRIKETLRKLDHPNLVRIEAVIGDKELRQAFLVMPLVEGGNLKTAIGRWSALPKHFGQDDVLHRQREIARLVEKLASAIHYLHERAIIHRDLKPANILIDLNSEPLVCDYGLARPTERGLHDPSSTNARIGTPLYMAPEQFAGSRDLTVKVDVYALGAILYELLTGYPPFAGKDVSNVEVERQRLAEQLPLPPHAVNEALPADDDLAWLTLQCLHRDPDLRPDAKQLAGWLKHYLARQRIRPEESLLQRLRRRLRPGDMKEPEYIDRWYRSLRIEGVTNPLAHIGMFLLLSNNAPGWSLWACLLLCDTLLGWSIWVSNGVRKGFRLSPMERDVLHLWIAGTTGEFLLFTLHCPLFGPADPQQVVGFYATWAVTRAMLFFIEGHLFWPPLRVVSAVYVVAVLVMPWIGLYAALLYGFLTGGWFMLLSFRPRSPATRRRSAG